MHIYSRDQMAFHLARTRAEKWFSRANTLLVAVQLACWLCAIIRTAVNASNSMKNPLYSNSVLQLRDAYLVENCTYAVTRDHAFFKNVTFVMSPDNVGYFVSRGVMNIRYLMAITGVHFVVSTINRIWFETNTHELRYHFVVFRKDMVTVWEFWLMILGVIMAFGVAKENAIMQDYLEYCSGTTMIKGVYNSVPPYIELYVSYFISVGVFAINALVAIVNLSKPNPRKQMIKEERKRREEWEAMMRAKAQPEEFRQTSSSMDPPPPPPYFGGAGVPGSGYPQPPLPTTTTAAAAAGAGAAAGGGEGPTTTGVNRRLAPQMEGAGDDFYVDENEMYDLEDLGELPPYEEEDVNTLLTDGGPYDVQEVEVDDDGSQQIPLDGDADGNAPSGGDAPATERNENTGRIDLARRPGRSAYPPPPPGPSSSSGKENNSPVRSTSGGPDMGGRNITSPEM